MIKVKNNSVKLSGLNTEIGIALITINEIFAKYGKDVIITSAKDGVHSDESLHYVGGAVDLRSRFFTPEEQLSIKKEVDAALGQDFDFVIERTHFHLEFDPK